MAKRRIVLWFVSLILLAGFAVPALWAQYPKAPETYSITETNSMMGLDITMQIYRDGSKAVVDQSYGPREGSPKGVHTRTLYDLHTQQNYTWNLMDASALCGGGTFSGDWGDPFAASAAMNADMAKRQPKEIGTETLNGIATKILEVAVPDNQAKLWVDEKYGLIIKGQMTGISGQPQTILEVKQLSFAKPPASVFVLPAACAQAAAAPRVPTEAERIAAETGGHAEDFSNAIMPPPSQSSCTVLFRILRADTMEPMTSGFQVALDTQVDLDHPASYSTGLGADGRATFSGGGLHEVTGQLRNGVLRVENTPPHFNVDIYFGKGGDSSALIYRQCFGPQTTLLFVVKNPEKLSDGGDWLWVKSGKFAAKGVK